MDILQKIETERASWQFRCIEHTGGPASKVGAMLLAALGKQRRTVPQFVGQANISSSGHVFCDMIGKDGSHHKGALVGTVQEMTDAFSRLGDEMRLNDVDRVALFSAVRGWINRDFRPIDKQLHFTISRR